MSREMEGDRERKKQKGGWKGRKTVAESVTVENMFSTNSKVRGLLFS